MLLLLLRLFIKGITKLENLAIDCSTSPQTDENGFSELWKVYNASTQKLPVSSKA